MKVALYLSGLMTNYQKTYQNLLKNIIEPNDCDIFIITTPYCEKNLKPTDLEQFKQQIRDQYGDRLKKLEIYLPEHHDCKIDENVWKTIREKVNIHFGWGKDGKDKDDKNGAVNNYLFDMINGEINKFKCKLCQKRYKFFWKYFTLKEIKKKVKTPEKFIKWLDDLYYSRYLFMKNRTSYSVSIKKKNPFGNNGKNTKKWSRMISIREKWDNRIHDQYYKLNLVNEMRKKYEKDNEIKYDAVIRCRPDALFSNPIKMEEYTLNDDIIYMFIGHKWFKPRKNDYKMYNHKPYTKEEYDNNPMRGSWNGFSIGNSEAINKYCQFYKYFGNYFTKDIVKYGCKFGLDPESQLLQYLELEAKLELKSIKKEVEYRIYRNNKTKWENFGASFK